MRRTTSRYVRALTVALTATALMGTTAITAQANGAGRGYPIDYLTGPADGDALEIARTYIQNSRSELGLTAADLEGVLLLDRTVSSHNGITHIYLRQTLSGVEVVNGDINVNVNRDGRIINLGSHFISNLAGVVNTLTPTLTAEDAVVRSADYLGLEAESLTQIESRVPGQTLFAGGRLSRDEIPAGVKLIADGQGGARLVWETRLRLFDSADWWNLYVDATNGDVLEKINWTSESGGCTECYAVYAIPKESPNDGDRTIEIAPADAVASPFGWHDTDGAAGAEFTDTRGNNVEAHTDLDGNNNTSGEIRGEGGPDLVFNAPIDLAEAPGEYSEAAVINLFYWNNIMHDWLYQYGFDEANGNFQTNNYGNGGIGGDPVQADAQDGSGTNNATFATPNDGADPRMTMFLWLYPFPNVLEVFEPANIADVYTMSGAAFGPEFDQEGSEGDLVLAEDGVGGDVNDGCEAFTNGAAMNGNIALVNRGSCDFVVKVKNAQDVGATAAVIADDRPGDPFTLGGTDNTITIPSGMVSQVDGDRIKSDIGGATAGARAGDPSEVEPSRDSDLDNGIIAHEYGHGLSNRLTGGPGQSGCLNNQEQMGEGWSDLMSLFLTAREGQTGELPRGIGTYSIFQESDGSGIRNFPYSTDLNVNPQVYSDIGFTNVPHGVGEIWAAMIWDMYWGLVDEYGFDPDFYSGSGGNNIAYQLLLDGLKLQGCSPSFIEGRDGILLADMENSGGANQCIIWEAFAKRGLGVSAESNGNGLGGEVDAFDVPGNCDGLIDVEASLSGTCPGSVDIEITGATPNGAVRLYFSESDGTTVVQQGQCSGLTLDLDMARLATTLTADGSGTASGTFTAGVNQCGLQLQAADEGSCTPSNGFEVP